MKSNIRLVPTTDMSREDWLRYRTKGLGASETGVVLGLSRFKSSIELFYEKIGESLGYTVENIAMFLGSTQEPYLAQLWEHWDPAEPTQEKMISNYRAGVVVRRCKRVNAYATNERWPWLFVSLDREINKHDGKGNGCLELKTIGGYEADKWESGIPPVHIIQVQTQMGVCEYEYGEIPILKDNRDFMVWPFEFNKDIFNTVVETTKAFWDKVEAARILVTRRFEAQRNFRMADVDDINAELQALEPEPDGSEAYMKFQKEKYKICLPGEQSGTLQDLEDAVAHKRAKENIKSFEEVGRLYESRLKNALRDGADVLDFGASGFVSWKANKNGSRVFLNKVKD